MNCDAEPHDHDYLTNTVELNRPSVVGVTGVPSQQTPSQYSTIHRSYGRIIQIRVPSKTRTHARTHIFVHGYRGGGERDDNPRPRDNPGGGK